MDDPKTIVREGYDKISQGYRAETFDFDNSGYKRFLSEFEQHLKVGDRVLDLGCGCGVPVAQHLSRTYAVSGVDISHEQIMRAKVLAPKANFVCADMTEVNYPESSFEAVVSFYAVIHVPVEQHLALFERVARWLVAGGFFLVTVGHKAWTGTKENWYGAEMYWSHADAATYRQWLDQTGFTTEAEHFIPEAESGHTLFILRKRETVHSDR
jgi:cyclopropane fatty-acyl-phospholipid synthase-like methyltransferase